MMSIRDRRKEKRTNSDFLGRDFLGIEGYKTFNRKVSRRRKDNFTEEADFSPLFVTGIPGIIFVCAAALLLLVQAAAFGIMYGGYDDSYGYYDSNDFDDSYWYSGDSDTL